MSSASRTAAEALPDPAWWAPGLALHERGRLAPGGELDADPAFAARLADLNLPPDARLIEAPAELAARIDRPDWAALVEDVVRTARPLPSDVAPAADWRAAFAQILAPFVHAALVPCPSGAAFTDLLNRVRDTALAGYRHQGLPFDQLVTALRPKRDLSRNPVVQVAFQLLGDLAGRVQLPRVTVEPFHHGQGGSPFDLLLTVREDGDQLAGWLQYNSDLFTAGRAASFAESYTRIVAEAVHHPQRVVGELAEGSVTGTSAPASPRPPVPARCDPTVVEAS